MARRNLTLSTTDSKVMTFREFVSKVRPGYRWYAHCERLTEVLQRVVDGKIRRLMIFMPPRHGKSELASRLFPAYWLYRYPKQWVGICSYGATLAEGLSRAARANYARSGKKLNDEAAAVSLWETAEGGGCWCAGVGGGILGKGWHLGVIDDPTKDAVEAFSDRSISTQRDWYDSAFYSREEPDPDTNKADGALVIIQQRWNDSDLPGWLLSREDDDDDAQEHWHVVNYEAIKEDSLLALPSTCTLEPDWRSPGEALCPERRPIEKLLRLKARNEFYFSAMYQQRPRPRDGAMFDAGNFTIVDAVPAKFSAIVRYWDKAGAAPGKGDWTVGVLMARCVDGYFWILNVHYGQWQAHDRNREILQVAEMDKGQHGLSVKIYVEQPPGLAKESTDAVVRMLAGFNVIGDPVNKDKVERAEPFSAQCRAGNVRMLRANWNRAYLDVVTAFPFALHDDHVDASSGAFNKLAVAVPSLYRGKSPTRNYRG